MKGHSQHNPSLIGRKNQAKFENDCVLTNGHRIKITLSNLMILVSFSSAGVAWFEDRRLLKIRRSAFYGTPGIDFHFLPYVLILGLDYQFITLVYSHVKKIETAQREGVWKAIPPQKGGQTYNWNLAMQRRWYGEMAHTHFYIRMIFRDNRVWSLPIFQSWLLRFSVWHFQLFLLYTSDLNSCSNVWCFHLIIVLLRNMQEIAKELHACFFGLQRRAC